MSRASSLERRAANTPRVQLRAGALYWEPSKALRAAGFTGQALGPLTVEALNRADALNEQADAHLERKRAGRAPEIRPAALTMGAIFSAYRASDYFAAKAPTTRRHYLAHLKVLEDDFGPELAAAVSPRAVEDWLSGFAKRSPRQAHNVYRTLRLVLAWAARRDMIQQNPASAIKASTPKARRRVATRAELAALIAAADRLGRPSLGDFCVVAVCTMQRVSDVLALHTAENLSDGFIHLTQGKTGRELTFRPHPAIGRRIPGLFDAIRPFVICEATGAAWRYDNFAHWFNRLRAEAAKETRSLLGEDRSVRDANYRGVLQAEDFRRTGMVWAAQGGASIAEIVSVSGHDIQEGLKILEVYLPRERLLADRAIAALDILKEPEGEKEQRA